MSDLKILIVEDSAMAQRMYKKILSRLQYKNYTIANDGVSALEILKETDATAPFEIVLCDWNMPEMDGIGFVKALRKSAEHKKLPVIMVTTETEKDRILEAVKSGINHYIVKPFTAETLQEKIKEVTT
ncbi:response regulator [Candidatus Riflebacteria bacterium]